MLPGSSKLEQPVLNRETAVQFGPRDPSSIYPGLGWESVPSRENVKSILGLSYSPSLPGSWRGSSPLVVIESSPTVPDMSGESYLSAGEVPSIALTVTP